MNEPGKRPPERTLSSVLLLKSIIPWGSWLGIHIMVSYSIILQLVLEACNPVTTFTVLKWRCAGKKICRGLEVLFTILSSNKFGLSLSDFSPSHRVCLSLGTAKCPERTSPRGLGSCCRRRLTFTKCRLHYHIYHRYSISVLEEWHSNLPLLYGLNARQYSLVCLKEQYFIILRKSW